MPNWCANRLTFSGVQHNTDDLRAWIKGEKSSLPGRAKREGIQLFLAGCAGLLRPETDMPCPVFPALTAHGVATESTPASQAFTRWLALFTAGRGWMSMQRRRLNACTARSPATGAIFSARKTRSPGGTRYAMAMAMAMTVTGRENRWIFVWCCRPAWTSR